MTVHRRLLPAATLALLCFTLRPASAQRAGIAHYDLDGLHDTIPSLFRDDSAYTPQGRMGWNTARYRAAIARIVSVIDSMAMPLVTLTGIESRTVAADLAGTSTRDYCYLHRSLNALDGMEPALLYYGDRFFPERSETGAGWLLVEGELDGRPVALLICGRRARFVSERIERLREEEPHRSIVVAGRTPDTSAPACGMRDALAEAERAGYGNALYRSGWRMADRIWVDTAYRVVHAGVYVRKRLVDPHTGAPRAVSADDGYSDRLPVFTYLVPVSDR